MFFILGSIGQWLSAIVNALAVFLLIYYRYDMASIMIASGSLLFGLSTKIKYYGQEYERIRKEIIEQERIKILTGSHTDTKLIPESQNHIG